MHDKYDVAASCLYFASKSEEDRRRLIEIVEAAHYFKFYKKINKNQQIAQAECTKVINKELILLQTLEFDFDTEHPFNHFVLVLNHWKKNKKYLISLGSERQSLILEFYFKIAWFFVYDALKLVNIVMNASEHISIACIELALRYVECAYFEQQTQDESNAANDFNFEALDKKNNILPFEIFESEKCLLSLSADWFKEFDDLLSVDLVNKLCDAIVDISDLEKTNSKEKNAMYIKKALLKKQRVIKS